MPKPIRNLVGLRRLAMFESGMSYKEIAKKEDVCVGTLNNQLWNTRKNINSNPEHAAAYKFVQARMAHMDLKKQAGEAHTRKTNPKVFPNMLSELKQLKEYHDEQINLAEERLAEAKKNAQNFLNELQVALEIPSK